MRNLFTFIYKNYFFFLFLFLEFLALYMVARNNFYHRAGMVNSSNGIVSSIYNSFDNARVYLNLKETNELLAKENAALRSKMISSYIDFAVKKHRMGDSTLKQQFEVTEAKVVNNTTNRRNNFLTLNRGKKQGIESDMAVISSTGIVGVVDQVSDNFCTVMSVLHKETRVNAKVKKDGNIGPLTWDGSDYRYATLSDLPTHTKLQKGDTIVTSALSITYPENIMIGTVETFGIKSGETSFTVRVKLSTEFKKLEYVYIGHNAYRDEQKKLEETIKNDK
jgi:rod shape-determining protein MreC